MLKKYLILKSSLILLPALVVFSPVLLQRIMRRGSATEISGSSGEINLVAIAVYIFLPNLLLYLWTLYSRPH